MPAVINPASNWDGYDVCRFFVQGGEVEIFQMIMIEIMPVNNAPAPFLLSIAQVTRGK